MIHALSRRRAACAALALFLSLGLIAGCGRGGGSAGGDNVQTGNDSKQPDKSPFKISVMNLLFQPEPPKEDNVALKAIEAYTNTKLDITWVPSTTYSDKLNATIASGEMPQIVVVANNKTPAIINALRSGMFWEIGPMLKDYPNLSKLSPDILNNIAVDGKVYGVYRYRPLVRQGVIIRKDWLDKLGLKMPSTVDDLYNVAKAFTRDDPDGNGKDDTYGVGETKYLNMLQAFSVAYGAPQNWGEKDGKLQPEFLFPEFTEALKLVKKMYDEKLINQDFAVAPAGKLANEGKAGLQFGALDDVGNHFNDLFKLDPNAQLDVIQPIAGPAGPRIGAEWGFQGEYLFPKSSVKTEEDLRNILAFVDKLGDEEMDNLMTWGVEGRHYTLDGGKPTVTNEQQALRVDEISNSFGQFVWDDRSKAMDGEETPVVEKYLNLYKDNVKYAVTDPVIPLLSQTDTEKGPQLQQIVDDAIVKFVMGAIAEDDWYAALDEWRSSGGDKMIDEYTAEYNKAKQ